MYLTEKNYSVKSWTVLKVNDGVLLKLIPTVIMYQVKTNMDIVEPFVLLTMMLRNRDQLSLLFKLVKVRI